MQGVVYIPELDSTPCSTWLCAMTWMSLCSGGVGVRIMAPSSSGWEASVSWTPLPPSPIHPSVSMVPLSWIQWWGKWEATPSRIGDVSRGTSCSLYTCDARLVSLISLVSRVWIRRVSSRAVSIVLALLAPRIVTRKSKWRTRAPGDNWLGLKIEVIACWRRCHRYVYDNGKDARGYAVVEDLVAGQSGHPSRKADWQLGAGRNRTGYHPIYWLLSRLHCDHKLY